MAAAAALARLELKPKGKAPSCSQESIKNQVRKELMAEAAASEKGLPEEEKEQEEGAAAPSVSGVYFICPLTGDIVRKDEKEKHLREAIQAYFSVDPVAASIMEIHTFNKDREKVRVGVETMAKYLDNICLHPEEEKYRKIKLQNKVFQVPSALLSLCWDAAVMADVEAAAEGQPRCPLRAELLADVHTLP
ncbi:hypothetical protein WISP_55004 [Willisornis vidua]|uniref:PUB domain-containing protein n=1 Tax=Willisornis vidua TaxID=1566151 RepID=A0ABQ9DGZ5_9PASS|nr:hypothetical protein WISP_55004 [Willisornis vidua]